MTEKTIYVANDGKEFNSKTECRTYEDSIFASNDYSKQIYFFAGNFNLYSTVSKYLEGFQFVGDKPFYEVAKSKLSLVGLFHDRDIIYIETKEAVQFLKESMEDTDYDTSGIDVGVNVWSDGEWKNMNKEIKTISEQLESYKEINNFFSSLDNFLKIED